MRHEPAVDEPSHDRNADVFMAHRRPVRADRMTTASTPLTPSTHTTSPFVITVTLVTSTFAALQRHLRSRRATRRSPDRNTTRTHRPRWRAPGARLGTSPFISPLDLSGRRQGVLELIFGIAFLFTRVERLEGATARALGRIPDSASGTPPRRRPIPDRPRSDDRSGVYSCVAFGNWYLSQRSNAAARITNRGRTGDHL